MTEKRSLVPLFGLQILSVVIVIAVVFQLKSAWTLTRLLGFVMFLIGMLLVFAARMQLGRSFSVTPQARHLVTHGLYSKIRNPIYIFGLMAIAGLLVILQRPWTWILLVFLALAQVLRARQEARILEQKFGEEYRAYRRQTWF